MGLLIDSTLLILAERNRLTPADLLEEILDRWGDEELSLSVMTAGELLHGCWRADTPARRARREEFVEAVISALPVEDVTLPVIRVFSEIDARLRAGGRKLPTSDLLIASTALCLGHSVVTGNPRHFREVPGLTVHEWA